MKYKYLKDQNESFKKQIDEQNKLIKSQTILIDKLTSEKIDLLSKLEIKTFNNGGYTNVDNVFDLKKLTNQIKIFDEIDLIIDEDRTDLWEKVKSRIIPYGNHTTIFPYNEQEQIELNHKLNKLFYSEKTIRNQNVWEKLELATEDNIFAIKKLTDYIDKDKLFKFTKVKKPKDWYQKHNNKQRFQGKNK